MDIVFVIDGNGGISDPQLEIMQNFSASIALYSLVEDSRIGIVRYSDLAEGVQNFTESESYSLSQSVHNLSNFEPILFRTDPYSGIGAALGMFEREDDLDHRNVMIIVAGGFMNDIDSIDPCTQVTDVKAAGN